MPENNGLKLIPYGTFFMGSHKDGGINAMVASWVTQVSFEPRRVAVAVKKTRFSHDLVCDGGVFTLCALGKDFKDKLHLFKSDKTFSNGSISGYDIEIGQTGAPILKDCVGFMECRVVSAVDAGDHTLFIGEVVNEGASGTLDDVLTTADLDGHYYGG